MANVLVQESSLQAIANAIRYKKGTLDTFKPDEMAAEIMALSGGGIVPSGELEITENGSYNVRIYETADVNVPGIVPTGTLEITENDDGIDVTEYAAVDVNVPTGVFPSGTKQITANGTYDVTNFASAEVDVPQSGITPTGTKQIASNGTHDVTQYANAEVAVPNTYSAGDEGKVVSQGALVAQGSDTVTENGTVDTTLINSLEVDVPTGGGDIADPDYPSGAVESSETSIKAYILAGRTGITSFSAPDATSFNSYSFYGCSALTSVYLPKANPSSGTGVYAFSGCSNLLGIVLPSMTRDVYNYAFQNCSKLAHFDAPSNSISQQRVFSGCTDLTMVVLRKTGSVASLGNINSFENTPFASGKSGGTLYVPSDLVSSYQSASNWSTILGYANNQIKSIESTHTDPNAPIDLTTHYADGTLIPT